jgi:hypothetical protein
VYAQDRNEGELSVIILGSSGGTQFMPGGNDFTSTVVLGADRGIIREKAIWLL